MPSYPVQWRGRDFTMTAPTVGGKKAFCAKLLQRLRSEALEDYRGMPTVLNPYLDGLRARVWWVGRGMSAAVIDFIRSPDGNLEYNRLLFGDGVKGMKDEELQALIDEKEAEQAAANEALDAAGFEADPESNPYPPANDYNLALDAILREDMGPKAPAPAASGSGSTGMPSTGA